MAQLKLNINGRAYDMSCDDGQEDRVLALSSYIDERMSEISKVGAANNELHLFMLTSLVLADELFELKEIQGDSTAQKQTTQTQTTTPTSTTEAGLLNDENVDFLKEIMSSFKERIDNINKELDEKAA
ncbi:MAG: cell division protein ZapA [Rickettsiales bacterium]|nr:cell division protein ZapA [Rickettsiales bacterium]|tara:strand:+ start:677 stop:1060 length:384 start_codon:yes stop_codon:yes gene_type:complete